MQIPQFSSSLSTDSLLNLFIFPNSLFAFDLKRPFSDSCFWRFYHIPRHGNISIFKNWYINLKHLDRIPSFPGSGPFPAPPQVPRLNLGSLLKPRPISAPSRLIAAPYPCASLLRLIAASYCCILLPHLIAASHSSSGPQAVPADLSAARPMWSRQ